jgi:hypothetical protein
LSVNPTRARRRSSPRSSAPGNRSPAATQTCRPRRSSSAKAPDAATEASSSATSPPNAGNSPAAPTTTRRTSTRSSSAAKACAAAPATSSAHSSTRPRTRSRPSAGSPTPAAKGRYHNAKYKALAEELGLLVERDPVIGWSLTTLAPATATAYADTIADLDRAITLHRRHEAPSAGGARPGNLVPAACACPRRIRVAPGTLALGAIICSVCASEFPPVDAA